MSSPPWWHERRYGLSVHVGLATVPSFAPIGAEAGDYFARLAAGDAEIAHHHHERWRHVADADDFAQLLTWRRFSGEAWAQLAADGGMGLVALTVADAELRAQERFATSMAELATAATRRDLFAAEGLEQLHAGGSQVDGASMTFLRRAPDVVCRRPWALHRPLGASFVLNRVERPEHLLSPGELLDVLTETVAKGGSLMLGVGATLDGEIPADHRRPIVDVGAWVNAHWHVLHDAEPFDEWGDAQLRYTRSRPLEGSELTVHAIDLTASTSVTFPAFRPDRYEVRDVDVDAGGGDLRWEQHADGLTVTRADRTPTGLAAVYRVALIERAAATTLFEPTSLRPRPLEHVDAATAGDVVQLADGPHAGPVVVPPGVTLRGLGHDRTSIDGVVTLSAGARLEHVSVDAVVAAGDGSAIVGCAAPSGIDVRAHEVAVLACVASTVRARDVARLTVERCVLAGRDGDVAVDIDGGADHRVSGNELAGHGIGARVRTAATSTVERNRIAAARCAIAIDACESTRVEANTVNGTPRAVAVSGGRDVHVVGNTVADGDSGCIVERGATDVRVTGNTWQRCRIGILVWDAGNVSAAANDADQLLDPQAELFVGP